MGQPDPRRLAGSVGAGEGTAGHPGHLTCSTGMHPAQSLLEAPGGTQPLCREDCSPMAGLCRIGPQKGCPFYWVEARSQQLSIC